MKEKISIYFKVPESRKLVYDYIRVISCIGIIALHVTGDRADGQGVVMQTFARLSLPMFVILSGALALGSKKEEPYLTYYYKRIVRIVIPYLIYSSLYVGWFNWEHSAWEIPNWNELKDFFATVPYTLQTSFVSYQSVHLWFVLMILGFYLVAPFLKKGLSAFEDKDLKALFFVILIIYAAKDYLPIFGFKIGISNFFVDWMSYFLIGYYLVRSTDRRKYIHFSILGIISIIAMFAIKWKFPMYMSENFYDLAPHMILACCGVWSIFMLIENALTKSKVVNWLCVKLSKYSFSVYLIHAAMLQEFLANHPYSNQTAIGILLTTIVVYIQAVLFVLIFDNLITFNVNRIVELAIRFAKDCFKKLMLRLKTDKLA